MVCYQSKYHTFFRLLILPLIVCVLIYKYATSYGTSGRMKTLLNSSHWIHSKMYLPGIKYGEFYYTRVLWESQVRLSTFIQPTFEDAGHVLFGPPIPSEIDSGHGPNVKMILLWTAFYGEAQWAPQVLCMGQGKTCITTHNKDNLLKSDALLMHPIDLKYLPSQRLPSQRWVYFIQDPPHIAAMQGFKMKDHNSVFNWTMTYRRKADFPISFYQSELLKLPLTPAQSRNIFDKIMGTKKRLVFVSITNCDREISKRLEVIKELQKYVQVDFYGKCGNLVCPHISPKCGKLFSEYKFVLAFENGNCRDYITEKVERALHVYKAVPIVMGGSHPNDYLKIMPPNSFINSQGFATVKELAYFINFLDENDLFYERFHLWRQSHGKKSRNQWCNLCKALHNSSSFRSQVYTNFDRWYSQDTCHQG